MALSSILRSHLYLANLGIRLWPELTPFAPPSYVQQDVHNDTECQNCRNKHVRNPAGQSEEHDDHAAWDENKERRCPIGDRDAVWPRNWEGGEVTGRAIDRYKGRSVSSEFMY